MQALKTSEIASLTKEYPEILSVDIVNDTVTKISLNLPFGPLIVLVNTYSVSICQPSKKETFNLGFFETIRGEKMFTEKSFDSESARQEYISTWLYDIPTDELVLETKTILDGE